MGYQGFESICECDGVDQYTGEARLRWSWTELFTGKEAGGIHYG